MFLNFPHKMLRAEVIKEYVGDKKVVCFSCGNASSELQFAGVNTLCIGGYNGKFQPTHWFTQKEISEVFPDYFDATPGHLSVELMKLIAKKYREYLDKYNLLNENEYDIMCGSGETLICLKLAYPGKKFNAVYNVSGYEKETEYNENAPLNELVCFLANKINYNFKEVQ